MNTDDFMSPAEWLADSEVAVPHTVDNAATTARPRAAPGGSATDPGPHDDARRPLLAAAPLRRPRNQS